MTTENSDKGLGDAAKAEQEKIEQEKIERLNNPDGAFEDDFNPKGGEEGDDKGDDKGEGDGGAEGAKGSDGDDFKPSPAWDIISNRLGEDFKVPEDLSQENEQEKIDEYFSKIYSKGEDDMPQLAKDIIDAHKSGEFDERQFLQEKASVFDRTKMTDDELIKEEYVKAVGIKSDKNPDGLTEEDINESIEKLSPVEKRIRANKIRESDKARMENVRQEPETAKLKRIENYNKVLDEVVPKLTEEFEKDDDLRSISGIDLGKAKVKEYSEVFKKGMSLDEKTGQAELIGKILNDDKMLFKVGMFLEYENQISESIQKLVSSAKGEGKDSILDNLDLNPSKSKGTAGESEMSEEEKQARLNAPEGTY